VIKKILLRISRDEMPNLKMMPLGAPNFLKRVVFANLFEPNSQSMQKPREGLAAQALSETVPLNRGKVFSAYYFPTSELAQRSIGTSATVKNKTCCFNTLFIPAVPIQ